MFKASIKKNLSLYGLVFIPLIAFLFLAVPQISSAQGTIPDDPADDEFRLLPNCGYRDGDGEFINCGFDDVLDLIQRIINWLLFIAIPLAAVIFTYAGILYLTAQGNPGQISRAHGLFGNVAIGLIIALSAWLIVTLLVNALIEPDHIDLDPFISQ
jgi:hypothetical protein